MMNFGRTIILFDLVTIAGRKHALADNTARACFLYYAMASSKIQSPAKVINNFLH
jgi:hypothetical protein